MITITDDMVEKGARALNSAVFDDDDPFPLRRFAREQARTILEAALVDVSVDDAAPYDELSARIVAITHDLQRVHSHIRVAKSLADQATKAVDSVCDKADARGDEAERLRREVQRLTTELRLFCLLTLRSIETGPGNLSDLVHEARHILTWIAKHPDDIDAKTKETIPEDRPDDNSDSTE